VIPPGHIIVINVASVADEDNGAGELQRTLTSIFDLFINFAIGRNRHKSIAFVGGYPKFTRSIEGNTVGAFEKRALCQKDRFGAFSAGQHLDFPDGAASRISDVQVSRGIEFQTVGGRSLLCLPVREGSGVRFYLQRCFGATTARTHSVNSSVGAA